MRSIALAMAWEYWQRSWWRNVTGLLIGAPILILLPLHGIFAELVTTGSFSVLIAIVAVIGFMTIELTEYNTRRDRVGFPQHLYVKPISTALMVALRMLLTITAATSAYLGLDVLVWVACGVPLRLLEPLLFLAVFAAWTDAAIWSLSGSPLLQLCGLAIGYTLSVGLFAEHIVNPDAVWIGGWDTLRLLSGVPALGLAYAVAVVGVRYDRQGARLSLARLVAWIGNWAYALRRPDRPFRSASAAQFWIEWHRKGLVLPALNILILLVYAGLAILTDDVTIEDGIGLLWGLAFMNVLCFPPITAMVVNARHPGDSQDLIWATRPLSDNRLLRVRLKVAVASLLAAWAVLLAGWVVVSGLLWVAGWPAWVPTFPRMTELLTWQWLLCGFMVALSSWTILGIVGSLQMTGSKSAAALWIGLPAVLAGWQVLVGRDILPASMVDLVRSNSPWALGLICLTITASAYAAALRRNRIAPRFGWICLGLYMGWSLLVMLLPTGLGGAPIHLGASLLILTLGLCTLPLLPLALGPLAVAWSRHR